MKMPNPSRVSASGYSIVSQLSHPTKNITGTLPAAVLGRVIKVRNFCPLRFTTQSYITSALRNRSRCAIAGSASRIPPAR